MTVGERGDGSASAAGHAQFSVKCSSDKLYSEMLDILERLVGFDTTSHKSNLDLIRYAQEILASNGIESKLDWNEDRSKANLIATAGVDGHSGQGILWWGHTDVVPVDGQVWTSDPFTLLITDERIFGRGTADMKGFIACCLATLSMLDRETQPVPITLVLTYDEEVGCVGARRLTEKIQPWADSSIGCIVGEPTGMRLVLGHKGKQNYRLEFAGEAKHAAFAPQLPNAIVAAAGVVRSAEQLNDRFRSDGPRDQRFAIDHSWINVGRIEGGVKPNIVPDSCSVELEIRAIPGHSCDDIGDELKVSVQDFLTAMRAKSEQAAASVERLSDTPAFTIDATHAFVASVADSLEQGQAPDYVSFGTEAGLIWGNAGIPAVVCGPGFINEAHAPNEFVSPEQLRTCLAFLRLVPLAQPAATGS